MFKSKASRAANAAANANLAKHQETQQFRQDYFGECHRTYSCIHCRAHLANHDELISKLFQGNHGRAYLFNKVVNVGCKQAVQRELLTGLHAVADIYCDSCETTLGWKYEQAFVPSQKYKEGKYIIELVHMLKENNWDLTSYNARQLLDETSCTLGASAYLEAGRAPVRAFYHKQYRQLSQQSNQNQQRPSAADLSSSGRRRDEQPEIGQAANKQHAPIPSDQQRAPRQSAPIVISGATIGQELVELIERSNRTELAARRRRSLTKETGDRLSRSYPRPQNSSLPPASPKGSLCSSSSGSISPLSSPAASSSSSASSCLASELGGGQLDPPEPSKAELVATQELSAGALHADDQHNSNGSCGNDESNGLSNGDHEATSSAV